MKRQQGFTMLEVLFSSGIFAIVMAAIIGTYLMNLQTATRSGDAARIRDQGQLAIAMLEKDVIEAAGVWTPLGHGASPSALGLYLPRFDENGLLVASDDTVIYYLRGDALKRDVVPGASSSRPAIEGQIVLSPATGSPAFSYFTAQGPTMHAAHAVEDSQVVRVQLRSWGTSEGSTLSLRGDYRLRNKR